MGLLIKNATIVNADKIHDKPQDILCVDGKIVQIAPGISAAGHEVIDAAGKKVLPGRQLKAGLLRLCACLIPIR
jgi:dihydroorotase-like cyclic amidohydrolase